MTRDELVDLARHLEVDASEAELDAILDELIIELPHGNISDLLYHTRPRLTAEQAVDEALRRQRKWEVTFTPTPTTHRRSTARACPRAPWPIRPFHKTARVGCALRGGRAPTRRGAARRWCSSRGSGSPSRR